MHKLFSKSFYPKSFDLFLILILLLFSFILANDRSDNLVKKFLGIKENKKTLIAQSLITPSPKPTSTQSFQNIMEDKNPIIYQDTNEQWGVAKQLSEHTWTLKVGEDAKMATAGEIFIALNNYRQSHGAGSLSWSDSLANFAQSRADFFNKTGTLDEHSGFFSYLNNTDNQKEIEFNDLGENSSIGYNLEAVHLIEWVYSSDEGHNLNQLNKKWTHVGIGVSGGATDLIFAKH